MDAFIDMLPPRYLDDAAGFFFRTAQDDGRPLTSIDSGLVAWRAMRGMRHAVAALAAQGNELIVDEVLVGDDKADYVRLLATFDLRLVGVHCPLPVLEQREQARGDRRLGLARWQFDKVHAGMDHDVVVDTSAGSPKECAQAVMQALGLR
ncbi:phosphotransferase-like protein [Pseudacidovorax intermedius]|uniref:phosphotransferase-like protein n=1 Tax=Pseudacidovorax intermedius TaxID=433924 RepID=UPI0019D36030|nr:chloramphenicol phosphotransferase [Pseudacidovorax intermedius]